MKGIKDKLNDNKYYDLIRLSENLLSDIKDITDKLIIQKKVEGIHEEILEKIQISINQVVLVINLSTKKSRVNICKRLNINIIKDLIKQYDFCLKSIKKGIYQNKYHMYLYSYITDLLPS